MAAEWNCDGEGPHTGRVGEVRRLPLSIWGDAAAIVCRGCYAREIAFRIERNLTLDDSCKFSLPEWETLRKVTR